MFVPQGGSLKQQQSVTTVAGDDLYENEEKIYNIDGSDEELDQMGQDKKKYDIGKNLVRSGQKSAPVKTTGNTNLRESNKVCRPIYSLCKINSRTAIHRTKFHKHI